jgi:hypothetical protein
MANQIDQASPGQMQAGATTEPTILAPGLSRMTVPTTAPVVRGALMPAQPPAIVASGPVMQPFKPGESVSAATSGTGDMKPYLRVADDPTAVRESYLRLRVRVVHGQMSIVGITSVDGPLAVRPDIVGAHAYQLVLDGKPIVTEGIPDVGVQRSYPRPGEHEHFVTERQVFEFTARVARTAVPADALQRVSMTLFRFPDASPKPIQGLIAQQFGPRAVSVAHLPALPETAFEADARVQARQLFPKSFP